MESYQDGKRRLDPRIRQRLLSFSSMFVLRGGGQFRLHPDFGRKSLGRVPWTFKLVVQDVSWFMYGDSIESDFLSNHSLFLLLVFSHVCPDNWIFAPWLRFQIYLDGISSKTLATISTCRSFAWLLTILDPWKSPSETVETLQWSCLRWWSQDTNQKSTSY